MVATLIAAMVWSSAVGIVLAALAEQWAACIWAANSFGMSAIAWHQFELRAEAEKRAASRRVEFRIDVPESSVVVINHQNRGPATIASPGLGKVSLN